MNASLFLTFIFITVHVNHFVKPDCRFTGCHPLNGTDSSSSLPGLSPLALRLRRQILNSPIDLVENFTSEIGAINVSTLIPLIHVSPPPAIKQNKTQTVVSDLITSIFTDQIDEYNDDYRIVCYFIDWAWYRPGVGKYIPEDTDPKLCTHINYAFAHLDINLLTIKIKDPWSDINNHFFQRVIDLKKQNPQLKVLISLGGWSDSNTDKYSRLIKKPSARKNFIDTSIAFLTKYQFDGLNINWIPKCWQGSCESGPEQDKTNFPIFIRELRQAYDPKRLLLTLDVSPSKTVIDSAYDVRSLASNLDFINVMAYHMHGPWDKFAAHHAPLHPRRESSYYDKNFSTYNIISVINHWLKKGMPKKKINLGIPFFGQSYKLKSKANSHSYKGFGAPALDPVEPGPFTNDPQTLAFYEICDNIKNQSWTKARDPSTGLPFAYKGKQWVGYDDTEQIRKKSDYIKKVHIGGAMVWTLDLDDFNGHCCSTKWPLLKTLNAELRGEKSLKGIDC